MAAPLPIHYTPASAPIKFGTDGWRGVIASDFTFERLLRVVPYAAQALQEAYGSVGDSQGSNTIVVGYDRRFLSEEFAQATAMAASAAGFEVLLADCYAPTPAFSWAVKQYNALGALVITASHNPGSYSGLKVKGAFGGSVPPSITQRIEALIQAAAPAVNPNANGIGTVTSFNPWPDYCRVLSSKVDLEPIRQAMASGQLTVFVDAMYGATAGGLQQILGSAVKELNGIRDPLFGGGAPEPIARYLQGSMQTLNAYGQTLGPDQQAVCLVFDGDGDRISAIDRQGNFLSAQMLIPILMEHLASRRGMSGEVIKSISSSDLIPLVAKLYNLPLQETPIGFKYIADRMMESGSALLGGEESGGIGYGNHIPERDGLLSALYLLEAMAASGADLSELYQGLQTKANYTSVYDRIDLPLASEAVRDKLQAQLLSQPPTEIMGKAVVKVLAIDGYKFSLADQSWLLIRFSGTEPLLRLYCEAATLTQVEQTLQWAKRWAES
jgi:phosphomannomutase